MKMFFKMFLASLLAMAFAAAGMVFLLIMFIMGVSAMSKPAPVIEQDSVLVFDISLNIQDRPVTQSLEERVNQALGRGTKHSLALRPVLAAIDAAAKDERITGLFITGSFQPDGFGSGFAALKDVRAAIKRFSESGKPVWASAVYPSARDMYIMSAADRIYLNPDGMLESAGMAMTGPYLGGMMKKYGIGVQVTRAGAYKSAAENFVLESMSEPAREATTAYLADVWSDYVQTVAGSTDLEPAALEDIVNDKGFLTAKEAKEVGLVDELVYADKIIGDLQSISAVTEDDNTFRSVSLDSYILAKVTPKYSKEGYIAVVYAEGSIVAGEGDEDQIGGARLAREIRKLRQNDKVKGIVLRVNSPGGSAMASEVIQHEIRLAKEKMPVVVSMGYLAASGGYWISAYADRIFAQPNTLTGSIGVIGVFFNFEGIAKEHGVNFDTVKTSKYADSMGVFRPKTEEEMAMIQVWIDDIYGSFLDKVAEGRDLPRERVAEIAQGRIWSGADALEIGLVDEMGGLEDAIAYIGEKVGLGPTPALKEVPEAKDFLKELMKASSTQSSVQENALLSEVETLYRTLDRKLSTFNDPKGVYTILPYDLIVN